MAIVVEKLVIFGFAGSSTVSVGVAAKDFGRAGFEVVDGGMARMTAGGATGLVGGGGIDFVVDWEFKVAGLVVDILIEDDECL